MGQTARLFIKLESRPRFQSPLSLFSLSHVKPLICGARNVEPMGLSIYVIRRNSPRGNPNIVQVQPKCQEDGGDPRHERTFNLKTTPTISARV